jgi:DNA replication and repair protein RecF
MHLEALRLYNFRNFKELDINLDAGINIFYGDNAQGKTNLLESIFFLAGLKPLTNVSDADLIKYDMSAGYVRGVFDTRTGSVEREVAVYSDKKKIIKEGGIVKNKRSELSNSVSTVFFSPDDLSLVKGEPSGRRRFIDSVIYHTRPFYYKYLNGYYRVLSHRNTLLKSLKKNISNAGSLDPWDEQLSEFGTQLIRERIKFLEKISSISVDFFSEFTSGVSRLSIKYVCCIDCSQPYKIKQLFLKSLKERRNADIMRTYTTVGPHRDDIIFEIDGKDARFFGSQGQQRLLVLCLKFAQRHIIHVESGEYPILLLDDVMSELDSTRRSLILENEHHQVFITTTDIKFIPDNILKKSVVYHVVNGELR